MKKFKDFSLRYKLIIVTTLASGIAIVIAAIAFVIYDQYSFQESTISDMEVLADVIGTNCTTSLLFDDKIDAEKVLEALSANRHIEEALLLNSDGVLFAHFDKKMSHTISPANDDNKSRNLFSIDRPIIFEANHIGNIQLKVNKDGLTNRMIDYSTAAIIIIVIALFLLFFIVSRLEHFVTAPIMGLASTAKSVSIHHNYDLRANQLGNDEVGFLVSTFNEMLDQISNHDIELRFANDKLEQRVCERTIDLEKQIKQRIEVEKTLAVSERRFRAMIEKSSDIIIVVGLDGSINYVSPSVVHVFNIKPKDVKGKDITSFIHPADLVKTRRAFIKISKEPGATCSIECRYRDSNRHWRNIEAYLSNLIIECGGIVINARDITERKDAENTIRASLEEKEVLLKEIHHRVKNNLQVICSLLNIQQSKQNDEEVIGILKDSEYRVKSMALIHEKLYRSHDLANIDVSDYSKNLITILYRSFEGNRSNIKLNINMETYFLGVDQAVPLGLVINELVSNALKHAFSENKMGELKIEAYFSGEDEYVIVVSDNGKGLPNDLDELKAKSLGLQLVYTLINQLDGVVEMESNKGTQWTIKLPTCKNAVEVA